MKKTWKQFLATAALVAAIIPAASVEANTSWVTANGIEGGQVQFNSKTGYIVGAKTSITAVRIPETIDGVAVVGIDGDAFSGCNLLESVYIPDTIVDIQDGSGQKGAFSSCTVLESVRLPSNLTKIPDNMFINASSLTSEGIRIPDSVENIGDFAFKGASKLKHLDIPDTVNEIGEGAFSGCTSLMSITFPEGLNSIPDSALNGASRLKAVYIPQSVSSVGNSAFHGTSNLSIIAYGGSQGDWGSYSFNTSNNILNLLTPSFNSDVTGVIYGTYSNWVLPYLGEAYEANLITTSLGDVYTYGIKRAQVAEVLVNLIETVIDDVLPASSMETFPDCKTLAVRKAFQAGVVSGNELGQFSPDNNASRQEIAVMVNKAIVAIENHLGREITVKNTELREFDDIDDIDTWARNAVAILSNNGIMNGPSATTFAPVKNTNIEEMLTLSVALSKL